MTEELTKQHKPRFPSAVSEAETNIRQHSSGKAVNVEGVVAKQKKSLETLTFQGNMDCPGNTSIM